VLVNAELIWRALRGRRREAPSPPA
jgi:hypothetical protein